MSDYAEAVLSLWVSEVDEEIEQRMDAPQELLSFQFGYR